MSFQRPVGPKADLSELEYVSSLHQTALPALRTDGTVCGADVRAFLRSRYGLDVELERAMQIVRGLSGDDGAEYHHDGEKQGGGGGGSSSRGRLRSAIEERDYQREVERMREGHGGDAVVGGGGDARATHTDAEDEGRSSLKEEEEGVEEDACLDIVQLLSVILIPTLARLGKDHRSGNAASSSSGRQQESNEEVKLAAAGDNTEDSANAVACASIAEGSGGGGGAASASLSLPKPRVEDMIRDVLGIMLNTLKDSGDRLAEDVDDAQQAEVGEDGTTSEAEASPAVAASAATAATAASSSSYPILTESLVRRLLELYYEYERAADPTLIREMVRMASGEDSNNNGAEPVQRRLDVDAFVRALTSDLGRWDVDAETRDTTTFYDVFGFETYGEMEDQKREASEAREKEKEDGKMETGGVESEGALGTAVDDAEAWRGSASAVEKKDETSLSSSPVQAARAVATERARQALDYDVSIYGTNSPAVGDEEGGASEFSAAASSSRVVRKPMASFIDFGIDSHRSLIFVLSLWLFYIATSATYMALFQGLPVAEGVNCLDGTVWRSPMGCTMAATILRWLMIAAGLTLSGYLVILPISLANNPTIRSNKITAACFILTATYTAIPYALVYNWREELEPPYGSNAQWLADLDDFHLIMLVTLGLGCVLAVLLILQAWLNVLGAKKVREGAKMHRWILPHNVRASSGTKVAASRKLDTMLICARALHPNSVQLAANKRSEFELTLTNFFRFGQINVPTGGFLWAWKRIWTRELFETEGIWIHSRLLIGQTAQIVVAAVSAASFFILTPAVANQADEAREELLAFFEGLPEWVYQIIPTGQQVKNAFYPAASLSLLVSLKLISVYIPSTVQTILSFRSGIYGSLYDAGFVKYRIAADATFTNVGNMCFAMLGSVYAFFVIFGTFIFLHMYPFTIEFMKTVYAWLIGLLVTILLKVVMMKACRANFHSAFYRIRPAGANFAALGLECWHIGLGGGVLIGRIVQFLLAGIFFIGRTDVPYLSLFVALGGYRFDMVPIAYWKEILGHEAHRHPYIDRLGTMYLMKLLHGKSFSSRAGACWRNLFVVVLFPWMMKHRVFNRRRQTRRVTRPSDSDDEEDTSKDKEPTTDIDRFLMGVASEMYRELQGVASDVMEEWTTKDTANVNVS